MSQLWLRGPGTIPKVTRRGRWSQPQTPLSCPELLLSEAEASSLGAWKKGDAQVTSSPWFAQDFPGFKTRSHVLGNSFLEQARTIGHPSDDPEMRQRDRGGVLGK